ncbi:hypothetical protein CTI12_AA452040 [Artemisia annua]|uniref:Uncharacterized protein n=1 Tax=Artemisia annua TaxID=35608 RepID=A0A2U1LVI7_ARTAN|nr:hypothetical protein CTI12_AA452040 [Artemisia annua]
MENPQSHTLKFTGAISDSKRIILASYTHYLVLSFFFLPLCAMISSLVFAIIFNGLNHLLELYSSIPHKILIYFIIYIIFGYTLTQCGTATITYSTHHRVLGNPMSLLTVLKSLKCTFFPIFFTSFLFDVLVVLITLTCLMFYGLVLMLGQAPGFVIDDHISFWYLLLLGVISSLSMTSGVIIGMILEKCSLVCMVVVGESKWGFLALKRSCHLHNETRVLKELPWAMWFVICIFCGGVGAVIYLILLNNTRLVISNLGFVSWTVFGSFFLMMVLLMATVQNSVVYNYHKVVHGELSVKIDQEFVHPTTDVEKVPHVVNVGAA